MNIRYTLRLARRTPATTSLVVVVLALGISASTALAGASASLTCCAARA